MGTVTVKNAAATQAILDQTIKSVVVNEDGTLTFTRWDDTTFTTENSLIGPTGPAGPLDEDAEAFINAAILAATDDTGKGVLAHDQVTVDQTWGFDEDGWNLVTGLSVTFNQVTGRTYRITSGLLISSGADMVRFGCEIRDGGTVMARGSGFGPNNGHSVQVGPCRVYTAGTTSSKTLTVYARGNTPNDITVESAYVPSFLTVEDIGVI